MSKCKPSKTDFSNLSVEEKQNILSHFHKYYSTFVEVGHAVGVEALDNLFDILGGQKPHVPTKANFWASLARTIRDNEIRSKFNGRNYDQLALAFGLHPRHIRGIVHKKTKSYVRPREPLTSVKIDREVLIKVREAAALQGIPLHDVVNNLVGEMLGS